MWNLFFFVMKFSNNFEVLILQPFSKGFSTVQYESRA
jgi:hypothetical protein